MGHRSGRRQPHSGARRRGGAGSFRHGANRIGVDRINRGARVGIGDCSGTVVHKKDASRAGAPRLSPD